MPRAAKRGVRGARASAAGMAAALLTRAPLASLCPCRAPLSCIYPPRGPKAHCTVTAGCIPSQAAAPARASMTRAPRRRRVGGRRRALPPGEGGPGVAGRAGMRAPAAAGGAAATALGAAPRQRLSPESRNEAVSERSTRYSRAPEKVHLGSVTPPEVRTPPRSTAVACEPLARTPSPHPRGCCGATNMRAPRLALLVAALALAAATPAAAARPELPPGLARDVPADAAGLRYLIGHQLCSRPDSDGAPCANVTLLCAGPRARTGGRGEGGGSGTAWRRVARGAAPSCPPPPPPPRGAPPGGGGRRGGGGGPPPPPPVLRTRRGWERAAGGGRSQPRHR
jgi:hypothetical protein